jgi:hypothetical protein
MSKDKVPASTSLLRSYPKNIFCLESLWDDNVENKLSVIPILHLVTATRGIKHIHLTCNTRNEFEFNLKFLRKKSSYQILYLAFHGTAENVCLKDGTDVSLEELSSILNGRFSDLTVHFGTCSTMNASEKDLLRFKKQAGIRMLSGYTKSVSWTDSAALEMVYFSALQDYKNTKYLRSFLMKTYPDLIRKTGFKIFTA